MNHLVGEDRKDKSLILKKGRVHTIIFLLVGPILQKIIASLAEQRVRITEFDFIILLHVKPCFRTLIFFQYGKMSMRGNVNEGFRRYKI